jgi:ABC-type sugar transport system ATPase subunit
MAALEVKQTQLVLDLPTKTLTEEESKPLLQLMQGIKVSAQIMALKKASYY